jgi:hypothetical protein
MHEQRVLVAMESRQLQLAQTVMLSLHTHLQPQVTGFMQKQVPGEAGGLMPEPRVMPVTEYQDPQLAAKTVLV